MARLYGRAGRVTAQNGGFRPGQDGRKFQQSRTTQSLVSDHGARSRAGVPAIEELAGSADCLQVAAKAELPPSASAELSQLVGESVCCEMILVCACCAGF